MMRTVKGRGVGKRAVMGRLKLIKNQKDEAIEPSFCREDLDGICEVGVSRLEKVREALSSGEEFSGICSAVSDMIAVLLGKEFSSELFEICEAGIGIDESISHIEVENEGNATVCECCLLLRRILNREVWCEIGDGKGIIAVSCERIDVTEILNPVLTEMSGIVSVGEADSLFARAIELMGISGLFVLEEDIEKCVSDAAAILWSERGTLYVSPEIGIIDEFTCGIKAEASEWERGRALRFFCGEGAREIVGQSGGSEIGIAIEGEILSPGGFEVYRSVAELSEGGAVTFLFRGAEEYRDSLGGIFRAAVYGSLSVAVSVSSYREYLEFSEAIDVARRELTIEKREFDAGVELGVIIDGVLNLFLAGKLSQTSAFFLVDEKKLLTGADDADRETLGKSIFDYLSKQNPSKPIYFLK